MLLRRWHRWFALPAALFLMLIAATGMILQIEVLWTANMMAKKRAELAAQAEALPDDQAIGTMMGRVLSAARREPGFSVSTVSLAFSQGRVVGTAANGVGPEAKRIEINALTGERIAPRPDPMALHFLIQDIHAGYRFGWLGRLISFLCGLSLLVLTITGLQIWYDIYLRRKDRKLFWK